MWLKIRFPWKKKRSEAVQSPTIATQHLRLARPNPTAAPAESSLARSATMRREAQTPRDWAHVSVYVTWPKRGALGRFAPGTKHLREVNGCPVQQALRPTLTGRRAAATAIVRNHFDWLVSRHGCDSESNHESTQNQMFFVWVMSLFESKNREAFSVTSRSEPILGNPLDSWVDSKSIPGKPLEQWVESI